MDIDFLIAILVLMAILCTTGDTFSQEIKIPSKSNIFGDDKPILVVEGKDFPDILGALNDVGKAFEDAAAATAKALGDIGKEIGSIFGSNKQPNKKNFPNGDKSQNNSMVKMISMYPPLDDMPSGWIRDDACSGQLSKAYRTSQDICDHYDGMVKVDTPNGVSVCNTGWKCQGYNYMGKRIDGTCNSGDAHKTQFQMTCDDDGSFNVTSSTPTWHIYSDDNNVWMFIGEPPYNVNRKGGRGVGGDNNDTRVVIREETGRVVGSGELKTYTPYFIQSFVNKAGWLGCNSPAFGTKKLTLKSVIKRDAKTWKFTGGATTMIKLSEDSDYNIRAGTSTYGSKWYAKNSTSGATGFKVWDTGKGGFEEVSKPKPTSNISRSLGKSTIPKITMPKFSRSLGKSTIPKITMPKFSR